MCHRVAGTLAQLNTPAEHCAQIYIPRLPGMPAGYAFYPSEFGLEHEDVWLTGADGVRLHAWFMWLQGLSAEERRQRPTVVFFQENAGNMSYRSVEN